uniref:Uncharacterized protein n=1 Tax=Anguilla anguilla TaxID=7936 RepID=A0A0E9PHY1_ANGAN
MQTEKNGYSSQMATTRIIFCGCMVVDLAFLNPVVVHRRGCLETAADC